MPKLMKPVLAAAALAVALPAMAAPNGHNNGTGWGVGKIPPGHQKKMVQQHYVQPAPLTNYVIIEQPALYGLPVLPSNQMYVRHDNEVYAIMRDTATVVEAIGIVSDLLSGS